MIPPSIEVIRKMVNQLPGPVTAPTAAISFRVATSHRAYQVEREIHEDSQPETLEPGEKPAPPEQYGAEHERRRESRHCEPVWNPARAPVADCRRERQAACKQLQRQGKKVQAVNYTMRC